MIRATTTTANEAETTEASAGLRVVGQRVAHHDFVDKVRGLLLYAGDSSLPGMLHGRVVRSELPKARIISVDTTAARALPGVMAVLTAADVPVNRIIEKASGGLGELLVEMPILAGDQVRYLGEPIALIAAATPEIADEAAERVVVDWDPLPGVYDAAEALRDDAPRVHEKGNLLVEWHFERGDVAAELAAADVVVEGEYRTQHVEHAYLEPESGVGWIDNGVLTLRVSTQVIEHAARIAEILNLPENKVRVIASYMGGGFGGKEDMTVEAYLALLVWHTRRPVRMVWDRQESLLASTKRHPFVMRYRTGARSDGTILAQSADILGDAGAYPLLSARVMFAGAAVACGPYRTPALHISSRAVFTNNVPTSAFRGFGAMQVVFGYESQMDRLAEALGLDGHVVRERNYLTKGDVLPSGERIDTTVAVAETAHRALAALGAQPSPSGPHVRVGRGLASNIQPYGRTAWFQDRASAWLSLQGDGSLLIRCGITDLGAGQAASLCQIASEILGVPLADISVYIGDSALTPPAGGTFATRQLLMSGNAVVAASTILRERIRSVAAELLGVEVTDVNFEHGMAVTSDPEVEKRRGLMLAELVDECESRGVQTTQWGTWQAQTGSFDPVKGTGRTFPDYTFGSHATDVEVDLETGDVHVLAYAASHDVGRAINPLRVEGQIQGGAVQGLGYALMEEVVLDHGFPASALFARYLIPGSMDMPDIRVELVESGDGKGPFGARGIGEPPIGPAAAAVASAIADAIGVRPTVLPMTPQRILEIFRRTSSP
jgi:CO/xanthine dehydrogenase Mo-binding subunit